MTNEAREAAVGRFLITAEAPGTVEVRAFRDGFDAGWRAREAQEEADRG